MTHQDIYNCIAKIRQDSYYKLKGYTDLLFDLIKP